MTSLSVKPSNGMAVFSGKASIRDITDPLKPIAVDGSATVWVNMTDREEPRTSDSIGITVWNRTGGI